MQHSCANVASPGSFFVPLRRWQEWESSFKPIAIALMGNFVVAAKKTPTEPAPHQRYLGVGKSDGLWKTCVGIALLG